MCSKNKQLHCIPCCKSTYFHSSRYLATDHKSSRWKRKRLIFLWQGFSAQPPASKPWVRNSDFPLNSGQKFYFWLGHGQWLRKDDWLFYESIQCWKVLSIVCSDEVCNFDNNHSYLQMEHDGDILLKLRVGISTNTYSHVFVCRPKHILYSCMFFFSYLLQLSARFIFVFAHTYKRSYVNIWLCIFVCSICIVHIRACTYHFAPIRYTYNSNSTYYSYIYVQVRSNTY